MPQLNPQMQAIIAQVTQILQSKPYEKGLDSLLYIDDETDKSVYVEIDVNYDVEDIGGYYFGTRHYYIHDYDIKSVIFTDDDSTDYDIPLTAINKDAVFGDYQKYVDDHNEIHFVEDIIHAKECDETDRYNLRMCC